MRPVVLLGVPQVSGTPPGHRRVTHGLAAHTLDTMLCALSVLFTERARHGLWQIQPISVGNLKENFQEEGLKVCRDLGLGGKDTFP